MINDLLSFMLNLVVTFNVRIILRLLVGRTFYFSNIFINFLKS
ncbi:uncharacterized protein METZ01_LOCUS76308 [marine metagenome]|uniref:Uncharacterized protein n=1 Tax=marine metagenome TaxID=408172 RepID=A0A381U622_9ZZZZ